MIHPRSILALALTIFLALIFIAPGEAPDGRGPAMLPDMETFADDAPEPMPEYAVPLQANAYHGDTSAEWTEWWYFNVVDDTSDLQLFFTYSFNLPDAAIMLLGVYDGRESYELRDLYAPSAAQASVLEPDVTIGPCTMHAVDADTFVITGESSDGSLQWNLTYERGHAPPYDPPEDDGEMKYLVYMPEAAVRGTVIINGVEEPIDGHGYHDHNWGLADIGPAKWRWLTAVDLENNHAFFYENVVPGGTNLLTLFIDGETIVFENPSEDYTEWHTDLTLNNDLRILPIPLLEVYPETWRITAENDEIAVSIDVDVLKSIPIHLGGTLIFGTYIDNEQVARITATIVNRETGMIEYSVPLIGFSAFTE